MTKKKRGKVSFKPDLQTFNKPRKLTFRGDGAKDLGDFEETWDDLEAQKSWTKDERDMKIGASFKWYALTQDDRKALEFGYAALNLGNARPKLVQQLKQSQLGMGRTAGWLLRMAHMGLVLTWAEKKFLLRSFNRSLQSKSSGLAVQPSDTVVVTEKETIQDRINAKLRLTFGHIEAAFDDFLSTGKNPTVMSILLDPKLSPPGNRTKDLANKAFAYLDEFKLAQSGKDVQLTEAYAHIGKREMNKIITWWEDAIKDINGYGVNKKTARKPRKQKAKSPDKIVSKLKYIKRFDALNLQSLDPTIILRSSEVWIYNTRTRKIGRYMVESRSSTFDVRSTRLTNIDPIQSVQKTLRKPEIQLKQFMALGKPASHKWFDGIRGVAIKLKEALNKDCVILKAFK
jgi:hypothetical protein